MQNKKPNICLIDDDIIYQFTSKKIIESTGLAEKIISFSNGQEAINFLYEHKDQSPDFPEIIFLDINMPVMDGWEFLNAYNIFKTCTDKKVIIYVVSSSTDTEDMHKARLFETVEDYIVKPIHKERFEELLSLQRA